MVVHDGDRMPHTAHKACNSLPVVRSSLAYCNRPLQSVINIAHRKTEDVLKALCFLVPTLETCPVAGAKVLTISSS